jgi:hypothetical protein
VVIALWYEEVLTPVTASVNDLLAEISWNTFQLSTIVAIGTILAVLYAAMNSDVRGR